MGKTGQEEMTYNHAMSISFAVSGSKHSSPHECVKHEKVLVIGALLERIAQFMNDDIEFQVAFEGWDTYEESELPPIPEV